MTQWECPKCGAAPAKDATVKVRAMVCHAEGVHISTDAPKCGACKCEMLRKRAKIDYVHIFSFEHGAWWRPGSMGYTQNRHEAGLYSREEAEEICKRANITGVKNEEIVELPPKEREKFSAPENGGHG